MTTKEFEALRPWHDGYVTDAGYRPPKSLIAKGYLKHVFDNFYLLTTLGYESIEDVRGIKNEKP